MTCKHVTLEVEDHLRVAGQEPRTRKVTAIVCTRGRRQAARCQEPGCTRPHTRLCDRAVVRNGKPASCDRKLCDGHAVRVGPDRDFCQAHARAMKAAPAPALQPQPDRQLSFFGDPDDGTARPPQSRPPQKPARR